MGSRRAQPASSHVVWGTNLMFVSGCGSDQGGKRLLAEFCKADIVGTRLAHYLWRAPRSCGAKIPNTEP